MCGKESKLIQEKWKLILELAKDVFKGKIYRNDTMSLYGFFCKAESNDMPISIFQKYLKKLIHKKVKTNVPEAEKVANRLSQIFDLEESSEHCIDWRMFLYMLNIALNLGASFSKQLKMGFRFFSDSARNLESLSTEKMDVKYLAKLFLPFLPQTKLRDVLDDFHQAWIIEVSKKNETCVKITSMRKKEVYITFEKFTAMLNSKILEEYFTVYNFMGYLRTNVIVFGFEKMFYPDILFSKVFNKRETMALAEAIEVKFKKLEKCRKRVLLKKWRTFTCKCKKFKNIFCKCSQLQVSALERSFYLLKLNARKAKALILMQSGFRRFIDNVNVNLLRQENRYATFVEGVFLERIFAATTLQKVVRGYFIRKSVLKRYS